MNHITKEMLQDCSTPDVFAFSLHCEECGSVWSSVPIRFSKAGVEPPTEEKKIIYWTLYQSEKNAAWQRAVKQAEKVFSRCPICRHLVCDHCFLICEELDMCTACANRLREHGEPVAEQIQDALSVCGTCF